MPSAVGTVSYTHLNRNRRSKIIGAAQHRLDFCHEDALVKGLGYKIVPAHVDGRPDVHIVGGRGDEDHRRLGGLTHLAAVEEPAALGQGYVHQDDVG